MILKWDKGSKQYHKMHSILFKVGLLGFVFLFEHLGR